MTEKPAEKYVVEQQDAERQDEVVEKCVVGGEDDGNFEWRDDAKAQDAETPGKKEQPDEDELGGESVEDGGGVKPVRQLLDLPANPGGERAVLVIVVHGGELAPGNVAAGDFGDAGFEIDAKPFPLKKKEAGAGWRICASKAGQKSRRREK